MAKWNEETRKGEVVGSTLQVGRFKLSVHRHVHFRQEQWLATAFNLFDCKVLNSTDLEKAKVEAKEALAIQLTDALNELKLLK